MDSCTCTTDSSMSSAPRFRNHEFVSPLVVVITFKLFKYNITSYEFWKELDIFLQKSNFLLGKKWRSLTLFISLSAFSNAYHTTLGSLTYHVHRSQIGSYDYLNCYMNVVYYNFISTPGIVRIHFRTNPRIQVFWENQFFSFCGAPKNFFWPQIPYLALETPTLGGSNF